MCAFGWHAIGSDAWSSDGTRAKSAKVLEQALSVYEQFLKTGSAAALNQIAAAYYTLGEKAEEGAEYQKSQEHFAKAAEYFCKAAEAGCNEAEYNAGLAYNKLKKYDKSAVHYRKCIKTCSTEADADLALKAAVNLSILVLEKNVPQDMDEILSWVELCKKYNTNVKAAELLQTSVVILTDINSPVKTNSSDESPKSGAIAISATQMSSAA
jgi:tetratricopeptide (TPR) repeat protein